MTKNKIIITAFLLLVICLSGHGQRANDHKGFYLSLAGGAAQGNINGYDNTGNVSVISGTTTELNFQIGAALFKRWVIHAMLDEKLLSGPTINNTKISNNFSLNESVFGGGLTRYTRRNFFLTANAGTGSFAFSDQQHRVTTKNGFSFLAKAGKEWWVSRDLAIGVAVTYNQTRLNNPTSIGISEKWNSNRIGVLLQATFN